MRPYAKPHQRYLDTLNLESSYSAARSKYQDMLNCVRYYSQETGYSEDKITRLINKAWNKYSNN